MKLLLLCAVVTVVVGQVPVPCISPNQFEGRFARFDRKRNLQEFAKISYDETQRRVREIEEVDIGSSRNFYDKLYLHNVGLEYTFNLRTRQCNVTTIRRTFTPFSVPRNAKSRGVAVIGISGYVNEHVNIEIFEGKSNGNPYVMTVTQPSCFPVSFGYFSAETGYDHRNFYDITIGVPDPNVFVPPKECIQ